MIQAHSSFGARAGVSVDTPHIINGKYGFWDIAEEHGRIAERLGWLKKQQANVAVPTIATIASYNFYRLDAIVSIVGGNFRERTL